jgi:ribosome-binding protein aMBF1 (putative translation factor)
LAELEQAVLQLEQLLRISQIGHVLGGETMSRVRTKSEWNVSQDAPPAPSSQAESEQYQVLLGKLEGDYKVAEAMIVNEARRHAGLSRKQLITRIVERFERHGR